jgi:glycerophosphoryl diester phosphodiesterase
VILLDPDARPIIAHRGASGTHPENTYAAFSAAIAQRADAIELDLRLSKDLIPVVMHDDNVDRTTDGVGAVHDLDARTLGELDAGDRAGVPTLDGVLERHPDTPLLLELKEAACAPIVATALRRHDATGRVVVGAFAHAALRPFRRPPFHCSGSRRDTAIAWAASRVGVAAGGRCDVFSVPTTDGGLTIVDRRFVAACRRAGRPVHVWTIDDASEAARLRALGVAGIITNLPERMRVLLTASDNVGDETCE